MSLWSQGRSTAVVDGAIAIAIARGGGGVLPLSDFRMAIGELRQDLTEAILLCYLIAFSAAYIYICIYTHTKIAHE